MQRFNYIEIPLIHSLSLSLTFFLSPSVLNIWRIKQKKSTLENQLRGSRRAVRREQERRLSFKKHIAKLVKDSNGDTLAKRGAIRDSQIGAHTSLPADRVTRRWG